MAVEEEDFDIVKKTIDEEKVFLNSVSQDIWKKPELGLKEFHAHAILTAALKKYGFNVEKHYFLTTAFRAEYRSVKTGGPTVAILLEYDALPDIGHACGHNLIAEAGLAAAVAVKAVMEQNQDIRGKIVALGTPAEETIGGKIRLLELGVFEDIDAALMVHPGRRNVLGTCDAMVKCKVQYIGKEAHAGASPWEGVNALDAAVACYNSIGHLRQQIKPNSRIHALITECGTAVNVIPARSRMEIMLRAQTMGQMAKLRAQVEGCIKGAATVTGCAVEYDFEDANAYSNLLNNRVIASLFKKHAEDSGLPFTDSIHCSYSTDMGNVSHAVPAIHPIYRVPHGSDDDPCGNHTRGFAAAAASADAQDPTLAAARAMALTALELLKDEDRLQRAKKQLQEDIEEDRRM